MTTGNYGGRYENLTEGETVEAFNARQFDRLDDDFLIEGLLMLRDVANWRGLDEDDVEMLTGVVCELTKRGVDVATIKAEAAS